jgi:hypothetical protein
LWNEISPRKDGGIVVFVEAVYNQLNDMETWTIRQTRLARVIEDQMVQPTVAGTLFIAHLEQSSLAYMGQAPTVGVDWSVGTINWTGLLAFFEQLMAVLLPLLGGL